MIIDLPSTTTAAVNRTLVDLRDTGGAVALGRVLTLVIVTDEHGAEVAIEAANDASREHPCRVIVIVQANRRGADRIDAQVRVGGDAGASEVIVLRLYGQLTGHADSVVTPLLLPDSPLVVWWPDQAPTDAAEDPIGSMAQRRITDAAAAPNPRKALERRRDTYAAGDTDLAWTRVTKWRGLLAAALDQPPYEPVERVTVTGASDSPSTDLLAAWLAQTLRCPVVRSRTRAGTGMQAVRLQRRGGPIDLVRADGAIATLTQPGQPDRRISLPRRDLAECLAEELRRLDPDEVYQAALTKGLDRLKAGRSLTAGEAAAQGESVSMPEARKQSQAASRREAKHAREIRAAQPAKKAAKKAAKKSTTKKATAKKSTAKKSTAKKAAKKSTAGAEA
ncbi:MAG TPA: glucose-6-phosphate dehydrogenase assembly protein OpcA [Angustibacter sp.]|nr:glucose-6-phosphate dehydrogenase assembly protein OpcA [Angustibacter sp.]